MCGDMSGQGGTRKDSFTGVSGDIVVRHCPLKYKLQASHAENRGSTPLGDAIFQTFGVGFSNFRSRFGLSNPLGFTRSFLAGHDVVLECW